MKNNGSQAEPTGTLKTSKGKVPSYNNGKRPSVLLYIIIIAITLTAIAVTIFFGKRNHRETVRLATEQFNQQQLILARGCPRD